MKAALFGAYLTTKPGGEKVSREIVLKLM